MTLPLYLVEPGALDAVVPGDHFLLDGPEGRHAATVKRARPGESLLLADGAGRSLTGLVLSAAGDRVDLTVTDVARDVVNGPTFTLAQALAKSDRDEAAIEMATELGVYAIIPWQAERSIVQWRGERAAKSHQKWVDIVRAATKQSRRTRVPLVEEMMTTRQLSSRLGRARVTYVLHEGAQMPLATAPLPAAGEVLLIVGPEGGVSAQELDALTAAGALAVRLGPSVLRSSTAGPAALAVLCAADRWQ